MWLAEVAQSLPAAFQDGTDERKTWRSMVSFISVRQRHSMTALAQQPYDVRGHAFVQIVGILEGCHVLNRTGEADEVVFLTQGLTSHPTKYKNRLCKMLFSCYSPPKG